MINMDVHSKIAVDVYRRDAVRCITISVRTGAAAYAISISEDDAAALECELKAAIRKPLADVAEIAPR